MGSADLDSITVVIPSKNREQDIHRCLESIRKQATQPEQVIVVDQSQHPYDLQSFPNVLHLYRPELTGLPAARNHALNFVRAGWVLFLDDDVELLNDCVALLRVEFAHYPDAAAIGCSVVAPLSTGERIFRAIFRHGFFNRAPIKRANGTELRTLNGAAMAVATRVLSREHFDERLTGYALGEDFEFSARAKAHGRLWLCSTAHFVHHESTANRADARKERRDAWDHNLYFYDKLNAGAYLWNRLWLRVWMVGESIQWLRLGMGLPPLFKTTSQSAARKNDPN